MTRLTLQIFCWTHSVWSYQPCSWMIYTWLVSPIALLPYSLLSIEVVIFFFLNIFKWSSSFVSPYGIWPGGCISSIFVHIPLLPSALLWAKVNGFTNKFLIKEIMSWCLFSFLHHFMLVCICLQPSQHFRNPLSFHIFFWLKISFALCYSTLLFP